MRTTKYATIACVLIASAWLAACGSTPDITRNCEDDPALYERAEAHDKIKVPEDLDELDELKEMPLPEAAPQPEEEPESPCLVLPPGITDPVR